MTPLPTDLITETANGPFNAFVLIVILILISLQFGLIIWGARATMKLNDKQDERHAKAIGANSESLAKTTQSFQSSVDANKDHNVVVASHLSETARLQNETAQTLQGIKAEISDIRRTQETTNGKLMEEKKTRNEDMRTIQGVVSSLNKNMDALIAEIRQDRLDTKAQFDKVELRSEKSIEKFLLRMTELFNKEKSNDSIAQ